MRLGLSLKLPGLTAWGGYPVPYLFQNGEQGFWYDPSDFSTLFQDAAGTTPVTAVEQPCSLMLDKRLGLTLGSQLVTNGDFSDGLTGWTAVGLTIAVVGGELQMTRTGSGQYVYQTITTVAGRRYFVTFNYRNGTTTSAVSVGSTVGGTDLLPATILNSAQTASFTFSFLAVGTASTIAWGLNAVSSTAFIDNISVRELPGNHAFTPAAASTARPTVSARVNLLTKTEQFDDAAWNKANCAVSGNSEIAPNGTTTADTITANAGTAQVQVNQAIAVSTDNTFSVYAKAGTHPYIQLRYTGDAVSFVNFDIATGVVGTSGGTVTGTIQDVGNGWYRCVSVNTSTSVTGEYVNLVPSLSSARGASLSAAGTETVFLWGADLRVANDGVGLPDYQRVNTATDYDPVGFPVYLRADGSNDFLQTNSIDFSGTDKVTLCAGVRKLSDAAAGVVVELGTNVDSVNGSFGLLAPGTATNDIRWRNRGTTTVSATQTGISAPVTAVLTGSSSISDDVAVLRNNTVQVASSTADQGTGNYGNYAVYLFSRAGSASFFNGRFYGSVGRGAQSNDQQIAALEGYMNTKTAAY